MTSFVSVTLLGMRNRFWIVRWFAGQLLANVWSV
jgi:hypothetical protein